LINLDFVWGFIQLPVDIRRQVSLNNSDLTSWKREIADLARVRYGGDS